MALLVIPGLMPSALSAQVVSLVGGTSFAGSTEHHGTRQGRLFGARVTFPVTDRFALRFGSDFIDRNLPELNAAAPAPGQLQTVGFRTSYLEVPILLKLAPFRTLWISPHLLAGAAVGMRLRCRIDTRVYFINALAQTTSVTSKETGCADDQLGGAANLMQLDARVGLGVDVRALKPMVGTIEVVYGAGLMKVFDSFAAKGRATLVRVGVGLPVS